MLLNIKTLSLDTSENTMLLEFRGTGKILYNLKKSPTGMCFSVFFRTFVKPFRVLPSYCNTKISEISDLAKSRTTYVAKGLANMINYSVAETRFDMNIIDSVISTEATRHNVRLMLPIMIHWAKTGQNKHTYGDLTHAIGKPKFSGIGHALYYVQEVLNELAHDFS